MSISCLLMALSSVERSSRGPLITVVRRMSPLRINSDCGLASRTNVTATTTLTVCPGAWTLGGNAGNPVGSYLGTADTQPLIFKVNNSSAGQLSPTSDATYTDAPNVVFGSSGNSAGSAVGATVAGGGTAYTGCTSGAIPCVNTASGKFSSVGGGDDNKASGVGSVIAGGQDNTAGGMEATVPGGGSNNAGGDYSFAGGIGAKVRPADYGTFVWSDLSIANGFIAPFSSTAAIQATRWRGAR